MINEDKATIVFFKKIFFKVLTKYKSISILAKKCIPEHPYRVVSIEKEDTDTFIATIQIKNRKETFKMKPENILADDALTDYFSQRDIRMLTYLGYLGINSPQYKILAKRLSKNDSKLLFAVKEKGKTEILIKTADEMSADETFIKNLPQKDAHMVGYVTAAEQMLNESIQIKNLKSQEQNR